MITLTQALKKLGKIVGRTKYRCVGVKITGDKKDKPIIEWTVYAHNLHWTLDKPTLKEALNEMKKQIKPYKQKKGQDVRITKEKKDE